MIKKIIKTFILIIAAIVLTILYSRYIGTIGLKTNEIVINDKNLNISYDGLKIVHFSDLHYKRIITKKRIEDIVNEINLINPDIVVFTGDLIDHDSDITNEDIKYLKEILFSMNSKYGKYAVLGNHDYSININTIREIYNESNFKLLENEYDIIYNENNEKIYIGGVSTGEYNESLFTNFLVEEKIYKILLLHEPDYIDKLIELNPDIALSGHSHNGQVNIPYFKKMFVPNGAKKYYEEYYKINETDFYISNGIGVSRYNFRLFNTPSINFYRINSN